MLYVNKVNHKVFISKLPEVYLVRQASDESQSDNNNNDMDYSPHVNIRKFLDKGDTLMNIINLGNFLENVN